MTGSVRTAPAIPPVVRSGLTAWPGLAGHPGAHPLGRLVSSLR